MDGRKKEKLFLSWSYCKAFVFQFLAVQVFLGVHMGEGEAILFMKTYFSVMYFQLLYF